MTQLLTTPTSLPQRSYGSGDNIEDIKSSALSLVSASLLVWQVDRDAVKEEGRMAQPPQVPRNRHDDSELWFSLPGSARRAQEDARGAESAYQATSRGHSAHRSASPSRFPPVPLISTTTAAINKPLPPSPEGDKKKRKPISFRSLVRRPPSGEADSSHLHPGPIQNHQRSRSTTANGNLAPDQDSSYYQHQLSRSMPNSPSGFGPSSYPDAIIRARSATGYYPDTTQYIPYQPQQQTLQPPQPAQTSHPIQSQPQPQPQHQSQQHQQQRSVSMETYFDPQPPRARRTFPESSTPSSAISRDSFSDRQRPRTWLSPTEGNDAFDDASELRLFVEATGGLPDGTMDFGMASPNSPPHLQGSLFARTRQNDQIPLPFQSLPPITPAIPPPHRNAPATTWHRSSSYDYNAQSPVVSPLVSNPSFSNSALPRPDSYYPPQIPSSMHTINRELERLGIPADDNPDDELPDYAQSQAEMTAKKRKEASDRARELESRWASSRSWSRR